MTGGWTDRLALRHRSLPVKLAAVLLVPTLFVVALGVLQIVEQSRRASSYGGVQQRAILEARTADLLGALAAERTAATVLLAGPGPGAPASLQGAAGGTTRAADALQATARSADALDATGRTTLERVDAALGPLAVLRQDVLGRRVDASGALARYTATSTTVLRFADALTRAAADPTLAAASDGLYQLSVAAEQDGYVRALVAGGIAAGRLDPSLLDQAGNALLRRGLAVGEVRTALGSEGSEAADEVAGPEVDARDRLVLGVLGRAAAGLPLQVTQEEWDRTAEAVQARDADVAGRLRGQLQAETSALQDAERYGAILASVILLAALVAGALVVWFVARSLLRPLRLLRRTALDVAERRLPAAVRSLREGEAPDTTIVPTPITTREEIGQVARAFDQVHEQAVHLAAEQAGLRTAFNAIFVNLSRRSQALVERQLRLIEQLENHEEDPEALSELFQLDHLATRMRRNSENLLVLAGTDLSRRNTRPVPLVDVLRAAASEVEQYQRVDLPAAVPVQILGRNADDVVHLVAELLENATTFSGPDTRVEVAATAAENGSLTIEVTDRGAGMSADDLVEANARLAAPPTVDVSASRRMGLFVVGRLAVRHGVAVTLRSREDGGLVAEVVVPAAVILPVALPLPAPRDGPSESGPSQRTPGVAGARAASAASRHAPAVDAEAGGYAPSLESSGHEHDDPMTDVFAAGHEERAGGATEHTGVGGEPSGARPRHSALVEDAEIVPAGDAVAGEGVPEYEDEEDDEDDRTASTALDGAADEGRTVWRRPDADSADPESADPGSGPSEDDASATTAVIGPVQRGPDGEPVEDPVAEDPAVPDDAPVAAATADTPAFGIAIGAPEPDGRARPARPSPSPRRAAAPPAAPDPDAPGPAVPGPAVPGPAVPGPAVPGPAVPGPDAGVPALSAPSALTRGPLPDRGPGLPPERTPIFEEVVSAWFREGAPAPDDDRENAAWWPPGRDEGWRAAAAAGATQDEELTAAGLPRRRPRARLVPGGIPPATPSPSTPAPPPAAPAPRRDPDAVRDRLASYRRGVSSARSSARGPATDVADRSAPDGQEQP